MQLKFEKTKDDKWYIVLPSYPGASADLEMIDGADKFLDAIDINDDSTVLVDIIHHGNGLNTFVCVKNPIWEFNLLEVVEQVGAYYEAKLKCDESGKLYQVKFKVFLCEVTEWLLGYFPKRIFIEVL